MLEKRIEAALVKATHQRGGLCLKFVSPSMAGVPDRIVLLPHGRMGFVEMKAPGKHPRLLQVNRIQQLQDLGFTALVCNNFNPRPIPIKLTRLTLSWSTRLQQSCSIWDSAKASSP